MTDVVQFDGELMQSQTAMETWAADLLTAYAVAVKLVTTSFVPDSYRNKPEEAAAAIMMGAEIGLSPLAALRSIDVIKGTPGMRAIAMRAVVQSHGHDIWVEEQTATRAIVKGRRKGSDHVEVSTWTIERAAQLGLAGNENYRKQPSVMLVARATAECSRLVDAQGLLGLPYAIEELLDLREPAGDQPATTAKASARRTVKRAALDPAQGEPPLPDELKGDPQFDESMTPENAPGARPSDPVEAAAFDESVAGYVEESRSERLGEPPVERDESAIADAARAAFESDAWEMPPDGAQP